MSEETEYPFPWMPLAIGDIEIVGWDGYSYVDRAARTYWSGAEPSAEDAADAVANPRPAPVNQLAIFAEQLALGYEDATTGIKLKTTEYAQAKFTSQVALVRLALELGAMTGETVQTIWDFDNAEQSLTTTAFLALMLRYGAHCKTMFDDYAP